MNKPYLNAAVASSLLNNISLQFMSFHDEINDMELNEESYNVELLMIRFFGGNIDEQQLPLIKAILTNLCEYTSTLYVEQDDDLDIEIEQMEFEF